MVKKVAIKGIPSSARGRVKAVSVVDVEVEDWEILTGVAARAGLTMADLLHGFAQQMRGRIDQEEIARSIQEESHELLKRKYAHRESMYKILFAEAKGGAQKPSKLKQ